MNQTSDDANRATSQTNAAAIRMMMRIGSCMMVNRNMEKGVPKARNVHPANSAKVIFICKLWECTGVNKMRL